MPSEITQHETNGICLLTLKGRLVLGQESNGLRTTIDSLLSSGVTRIVIGLELGSRVCAWTNPPDTRILATFDELRNAQVYSAEMQHTRENPLHGQMGLYEINC